MIRIREPGGDRDLALPIRIGGAPGDTLVVPGAEPESLLLHRVDGELGITALKVGLRLNGAVLRRDIFTAVQPGDVVSVGDTRLVWRAHDHLEVRHLEGNETVAPIDVTSGAVSEDSSDERISALVLPNEALTISKRHRLHDVFQDPTNQKLWIAAASLMAVFLALVVQLSRLEPVRVSVVPAQAEVSASGFGWRSGDTLLTLPGERKIRAKLEGYQSIERTVVVREGEPLVVDLQLLEKPGVLEIDTGGVTAKVFVDGAEVGRAPGDVEAMSGKRTLTLRTERHLDYVTTLDVEGRGARQAVSVKMQPSWGSLEVSATSSGARLAVDGATPIELPTRIDLPAGLHRLKISAEGAKSWQSAVLLKAGETQRIGPIELGAPDARVKVSSRPSGAEVTVGGVFRGRTPLQVELPAGVQHDVALSLQGYESEQRRVFAESNRDLAITVGLRPIPVRLTIQGEPAESEVVIGGVVRGKTPLTLELPARRHTLELRKAGLQTERLDVDLSAAVERTVEYRLVPVGRAKDWKPPPPALRAQTGTLLRLIEGGAFVMGSERREQGRRANEYPRRVTLSRPFYLGTREVTNGEFRRFKPSHSSGFVGKRTLDLDAQPVSNITWNDAVQYCNWLSTQEGLPAAYEQKGGAWVLIQPVTTGYRLPTEAEWEFVARHTGKGAQTQRYEWGDALPPPPGVGNLAGQEAIAEMSRVLEDWRDDYEVVAPPGKFRANGFGIFDMTGNVSEWIHDAYISFEANASGTDPTGPAVTNLRRVIKGSHWRTSTFADLRAAWREGSESASQDLGFRVARYAE